MKLINVVGLAVEGPERHPWSVLRWAGEVAFVAFLLVAVLAAVWSIEGFMSLPSGEGTGYSYGGKP